MAFFHGQELMIAPGVLFSAVAVGLIVAYVKIKAIRENWVLKIIFPVAAFAIGILGLLLLLGGLDELVSLAVVSSSSFLYL